MNKKSIDISKSSLLSLKAEVLRKQEEVNKAKLSAKAQFVQSFPRPKPKTDIFSQKNPGINDRNNRDIDEEEEDLLRKSRKMLEAKSRLYDKLSKKTHILSEEDDVSIGNQYLVQFSQKVEEGKDTNSDEDIQNYNDYDDINVDPEDDWVEYTDCLGRTRKCLHRDLSFIREKDRLLNESLPQNRKIHKDLPEKESVEIIEEENQNTITDLTDKNELLSNDMKRELMRQEWEKQEVILQNKSDIHYQDILFNEARSHGVGYFSFSQDEEERIRQQHELKKLRDETKQKQNIIEEQRKMREKQLAAREKAARNRKRARMGLPPEEDVPEPVTSSDLAEKPEKPEEEIKKIKEDEELEKQKEVLRKRIVRPWDIGKEGIRREVKSQEEWVSEKRAERPKEFAPPNVYKDKKERESPMKDDNEDCSLFFTSRKKKPKRNWKNDMSESSNNEPVEAKRPFVIDISIPPPNFIPGPVLFNNTKSINPYKNLHQNLIPDEQISTYMSSAENDYNSSVNSDKEAQQNYNFVEGINPYKNVVLPNKSVREHTITKLPFNYTDVSNIKYQKNISHEDIISNPQNISSPPLSTVERSKSGFQNTFKPVPIINECNDVDLKITNDRGNEKYDIDDLSDSSSSDDDRTISKRVEIPPPPTFEYYGPTSTNNSKQKTVRNQLEASVAAGLKFLRQQTEKKKARTEHVGFFD